MYNIYGFYAFEAVFFISGKCTDEQINEIDCRARAYYAEKSWNEFVPERIEICYPAVCPCRTAQKHCGADAEHKARVGESAGMYRAPDLFEKFHIRIPFDSFYISCSVTYRYILAKRQFNIKKLPGRTVVALCSRANIFCYLQTSSPFSTSTVMVESASRSPERIFLATRVSRLLCRYLRSGLAP